MVLIGQDDQLCAVAGPSLVMAPLTWVFAVDQPAGQSRGQELFAPHDDADPCSSWTGSVFLIRKTAAPAPSASMTYSSWSRWSG